MLDHGHQQIRERPGYRTLLLGLKPSSTYVFHVEVTGADDTLCKGADENLTTGTLSGAPTITRKATKAAAQAVGFVILSGGVNKSGTSGINQAFIVDADGVVVWTAPAPCSTTAISCSSTTARIGSRHHRMRSNSA